MKINTQLLPKATEVKPWSGVRFFCLFSLSIILIGAVTGSHIVAVSAESPSDVASDDGPSLPPGFDSPSNSAVFASDDPQWGSTGVAGISGGGLGGAMGNPQQMMQMAMMMMMLMALFQQMNVKNNDAGLATKDGVTRLRTADESGSSATSGGNSAPTGGSSTSSSGSGSSSAGRAPASNRKPSSGSGRAPSGGASSSASRPSTGAPAGSGAAAGDTGVWQPSSAKMAPGAKGSPISVF